MRKTVLSGFIAVEQARYFWCASFCGSAHGDIGRFAAADRVAWLMAHGLYAIMRWRGAWLAAAREKSRVAPVMRWLVVLVFFAGLIYLGGREILELGADGVLVVAVLVRSLSSLRPASPWAVL